MNFSIQTIPANGCTGLYADGNLVAYVRNGIFDNEMELNYFDIFEPGECSSIYNEDASVFAKNACKEFLKDKIVINHRTGWCTKEQSWEIWRYKNKP